MRTITVVCEKGGVTKTTLAIHLAGYLSLLGKHVLLIDFDPQGTATTALNLEAENGVYSFLGFDRMKLTDLVRRVEGYDNFMVLPGNEETSDLMGKQKLGVDLIARKLKAYPGLDYVVIDTAPSYNVLQGLAIWAASHVIMPALPDYYSVEALYRTYDHLVFTREANGWKGKVIGVALSQYEEVTNQTQHSLEDLKNFAEKYEIPMLPVIHKATFFPEAAAAGKLVFNMPQHRDTDKRAVEEMIALAEYVRKVTK
jgi:chromosome partitioning protein